MKKIILFLAVTALTFTSCKEDGADRTVKELTGGYTLARYIGNVSLSNGGAEKKLTLGMVLEEGDVISTGKSSIAEISVNKKGYISADSKVVMDKLLHSSNQDVTDVGLDRGKVLVGISKLKKGSRFTVKSKTAVASVRGTTFRVSSERSKSKVEVVKGIVRVEPVKDGVVVENAMVDVTKEKSVEITIQKAEKISMKEEVIEIEELKMDDIKEISAVMKETKTIEKLAPETRKEAERVIEDLKTTTETINETAEVKAVDEDKVKKKEEQRAKKLEEKRAREAEKARKMMEARQKKIAAEKARKDEELRKKEEALKEAARLKKQKEDRVKNVPNL